MILNPIGAYAAITTIISIWFGHVMVRTLEAKLTKLKPVIIICVILGVVMEFGSMIMVERSLSSILGILSITFFWDTLEIFRQERRVQKGYAPANPYNPRHAAILANFPSATTVNLTARNPRGYPYSDEEIEMLLQTGKLGKRGESE